VRFAARLAPDDDCDIIVLYVRPIDQALWSGGLQLRLARQNMLEAGFELPGLRDLKKALEVLKEEGIDADSWPKETGHQDAWGDPLGDNKVEYRSPEGRNVVLKLKTAPDPAAGIVDQYELGSLQPDHSRRAVALARRVQVVVARRRGADGDGDGAVLGAGGRDSLDKKGFFICTDGTARSMQAVRRSAVLAHTVGQPITLFSVAATPEEESAAEENVKNARALLKAIGIKVKDTRTAVGDPAADHRARLGPSDYRRFRRGPLAPAARHPRLDRLSVVRGARTSVLDVR
jgi:nucleotide-binding universal stress UspA family protein